jgi:rhodanese-related sulfurtransferase
MKRVACYAFLGVLLSLPQVAPATGVKEMAPQRVYDLLKEGSGLWLVDLRGPFAFEQGHIEGSVNILGESLVIFDTPARKMLVLVDNSLGQIRAREAAEALDARGGRRVFVLSGGLQGWRQEGLPWVGELDAWDMVKVLPGEFQKAMKGKVPMEIHDLRDAEAIEHKPLAGSRKVPGKVWEEKRANLLKLLSQKEKKGLAEALNAPRPVVVVFPAGVDAKAFYQQYLFHLPGDIRVLEGAHLGGHSNRGRLTISTAEGCPTCPGELREGGLQ